MFNERLLHNLVLRKGFKFHTLEKRKQAIASSNLIFYSPSYDKKFNFERLKKRNGLGKYIKKSSYGTVNIQRDYESDRMKKDRFIGNKLVRNFLKNETRRIINEDLNDI